ncbi:hypothetical protein [Micromonospora sp. NPDC000668]|uniref:hypothetical protein n=1 Tax=Micromonospora sp. NPDC000668 TaxID=3364219 RepID=UPI00367FEA73
MDRHPDLVDAARAYLQVGDLGGAARALVDADSVAPAEVRCRPLARTVIADVARVTRRRPAWRDWRRWPVWCPPA